MANRWDVETLRWKKVDTEMVWMELWRWEECGGEIKTREGLGWNGLATGSRPP